MTLTDIHDFSLSLSLQTTTLQNHRRRGRSGLLRRRLLRVFERQWNSKDFSLRFLLVMLSTLKQIVDPDAFASPNSTLRQKSMFLFPKGEVHIKEEIRQDVTLHDLDAANA